MCILCSTVESVVAMLACFSFVHVGRIRCTVQWGSGALSSEAVGKAQESWMVAALEHTGQH